MFIQYVLVLPHPYHHHPPTLPTQSLQPVLSLPIGPGISTLLTSLTLSQKPLRLPIITFQLKLWRAGNKSCHLSLYNHVPVVALPTD